MGAQGIIEMEGKKTRIVNIKVTCQLSFLFLGLLFIYFVQVVTL